MGFDYFTVENAPASAQVPLDFTPVNGRLPGHWNTMGHIESTAAATAKSYFRWTQGMAAIAADVLRNAGLNDLDTVKGRVVDPTRRYPPNMGMMRSINMGLSLHGTVGKDGKTPVVSGIPSNLSSDQAALNLRNEEAEIQRKAGPKAHKDQCWKCSNALENPLRCSRCKQALYCSKECQSQHWKNAPLSFPSTGVAVAMKGHKSTCRAPVPYSLADAMFSYNEGFLVTPGECEQIATALGTPEKVQSAIDRLDRSSLKEAIALQGGDKEQLNRTMLSFGEYCQSAAELGGFYVW